MERKFKEPSKKISPNAIKLWRVTNIIVYFFTFCALGILLFLRSHFQWAEWWDTVFYALGIYMIISCIIELTVVPVYKQKTWRYEIDEQSIQLKYGGIIKRSYKIIPMNKVYYVHTYQHPLLQMYKLSTIKIGTIAHIHEVPALPEEQAIYVRELIATLSKSNHSNIREKKEDIGEPHKQIK